MTNPRKSIAVIATVDKDGNVTYDQLFRNKDAGTILVPRKSLQVTDNRAIIYGQRKSTSTFGTLRLR